MTLSFDHVGTYIKVIERAFTVEANRDVLHHFRTERLKILLVPKLTQLFVIIF